MNHRTTYNKIKFDSRPSPAILEIIKGYGFRWNSSQQCWYAPASITTATVADCIKAGEVDPAAISERVAERGMEADCGII